jgi:hypothetical protein
VVFACDPENCVAVARVTVKMNWHDGLHAQAEILSSSLDLLLHLIWGQVHRIGLDVAQDGSRADMLDYVDSGAECERRSNHSVTRADS